MRNVTTEVKGDKLIITVDISAKAVKEAAPSQSGKSRVIATTGGNQPINGYENMKFGLTVYTK